MTRQCASILVVLLISMTDGLICVADDKVRSAPCAFTTVVLVSSRNTFPSIDCPNISTGMAIATRELRRLVEGLDDPFCVDCTVGVAGGLALGFVTELPPNLRSHRARSNRAGESSQYGFNFFFKLSCNRPRTLGPVRFLHADAAPRQLQSGGKLFQDFIGFLHVGRQLLQACHELSGFLAGNFINVILELGAP